MDALTLVKQLYAVIRQAEEAQSAFGYIATSLEQEGDTTPKEIAKHARLQAENLRKVLNPKEE